MVFDLTCHYSMLSGKSIVFESMPSKMHTSAPVQYCALCSTYSQTHIYLQNIKNAVGTVSVVAKWIIACTALAVPNRYIV